jgi:hypothetical protein
MFDFFGKVLDLLGKAWRVSLIVCVACGALLFAPLRPDALLSTVRAGNWGAGLLVAFVFSAVSCVVQSVVVVLGWAKTVITAKLTERAEIKRLRILDDLDRCLLEPILTGEQRVYLHVKSGVPIRLELAGILRRGSNSHQRAGDPRLPFVVEEWALQRLRRRPDLLKYDSGRAETLLREWHARL